MRKLLFILPVTLFLLSFVAPQAEQQLMKTQLMVTVLDDLGNIQQGAKVTLYETEDDYNKLQNPVMESKMTNEKGQVRFVGVKDIEYYVAAEKGDNDNFLRAEKTKHLAKGKINKINVIID